MIIMVRVGLGLAYQGASSSPSQHQRNYHYDDPTSSSPQAPSGHKKISLATFQTAAAASSQDGDILQQNMPVGSSSRSSKTKLDITIVLGQGCTRDWLEMIFVMRVGTLMFSSRSEKQ